MFVFDYKDIPPRYFKLEDNYGEVSGILYSLNNNVLDITDIKTTTTGKNRNPNEFLGTKVFNELLIHLKEIGEDFEYITGKLKYMDAMSRLWENSIPFYDDFTKYLEHEKLDYKLKFHLYEDLEMSVEVVLSEDRKQRKEYIKEFQSRHADLKQDARFKYEKYSD